MEINLKNYGEFLRTYAKKNAHSGRSLADLCGINRQTFNDMLHGKNIGYENLLKIMIKFPEFDPLEPLEADMIKAGEMRPENPTETYKDKLIEYQSAEIKRLKEEIEKFKK